VGGAEGERCTGCPAAIAAATSYLLDAVQLVQLAFERGAARRTLRYGQRVAGHALDLAHDQREHSVRKESGQQREGITGVLGDVPGR
jgi:hypothetical protein